jgi:hypothetical protein
VQYSQSLNLSLEERVRRKLILAGILPKLSNFDQGAIGQAIDAAGAGQSEGFIRRLSMTVFLSLTERDASTKPNVQRSGRVSNATAQRPFGEEISIRDRNVQS